MQNSDREKLNEDAGDEAGESSQVMDNQLDFAEQPEEGEGFGVDPPIIVSGGGKSQG